MEYITKRLSDESRKYWEQVSKSAIPYTEEEMESIAFDDPRMDIPDEVARYDAYIAQKMLAEDDELRRKEEQEKQ